MDTVLWILAVIFVAGGCFFSLTGALGVLRMPDFFSRLHPAGKNDTLGVTLIMTGLLFWTAQYGYGVVVGAKLILIMVFIFITCPTATHAIIKAAYLDGLTPWQLAPPSSGEEAGPAPARPSQDGDRRQNEGPDA